MRAHRCSEFRFLIESQLFHKGNVIMVNYIHVNLLAIAYVRHINLTVIRIWRKYLHENVFIVSLEYIFLFTQFGRLIVC